jgi:hypothetical protein
MREGDESPSSPNPETFKGENLLKRFGGVSNVC